MSLSKTIIFDMDGVITGESNYWKTAALTIWERYNEFTPELEKNADSIKNQVFCADRTISLCKNMGINSNWDLTFVVYAFLELQGADDYTGILTMLEQHNMNALELYDWLAEKGYERTGTLWQELQDGFQQWYLGDELYEKQYGHPPSRPGKNGMVHLEQPIFGVEQLRKMLIAVTEKGYRLGVATGRPGNEIIGPLKSWGLYEYFDEHSIITYDFVERAEKLTGETLTKPHPYMFIKALLGADYPDEKIISGDYDNAEINRAIAIGDAGADMLAAQAAGMRFIAVLTGVNGQAARGYFEQNKADAILNNVLEIEAWINE